MKKIILLMMMTMFFSGTVFAKKIYLDSVHDKCVSIIKNERGHPLFKNSCNFVVRVFSCFVSGGTVFDRIYNKCGKHRVYKDRFYTHEFRLASDTHYSSVYDVLTGGWNDIPAFKVEYFACAEPDASVSDKFFRHETAREVSFERRGDKGDGVCYIVRDLEGNTQIIIER